MRPDLSKRRRPLLLEVCAWSAGVCCLLLLLFFRAEAASAAHAAQRLGSQAQDAKVAGTSAGPRSEDPDLSTFQGVIGRLDLPALGLRVPILNDYDPASLRKGVGRIKGTAVPGGLGNFVLAGHRDTYFRPLRHIAPGMTMRVTTPGGIFDYIVDDTRIVSPEDVDVLDIGDRPEMTLITCFPFDFVGAAPKRFIVRAHLASVDGAAQ